MTKECRPVVFQSPPCVSLAPPAAFPRTPAVALLTAPAVPERGPHGKCPPGQFTAQQKLRLGKADYSILKLEQKIQMQLMCC